MGWDPRTKGKITQMKNGSFIYKTDIRPTRLFGVNITSLETLMVSEMGTVLLIFPHPSLSLSVWVFVWEEDQIEENGLNRKSKGVVGNKAADKEAGSVKVYNLVYCTIHSFVICFISWSTTYRGWTCICFTYVVVLWFGLYYDLLNPIYN